MNKNQLTSISNLITQFEPIDFAKTVAALYRDQPDLSSVIIGNYSAKEIIVTVDRVIKQLKEEINGELKTFLPHDYQFSEFGAGNLQSDLQVILTSIKQGNIGNMVGALNRLVYYQIVNSFWDRSTRKLHRSGEVSVIGLRNELDAISKHLTEYSKINEKLISSLNAEKQKLTDFIGHKNGELQQITNSLQTVRSQTNEIATLLNNSTASNEKINSLNAIQSAKVGDLGKLVLTEKENVESLKKDLQSNIQAARKVLGDFEKQVKLNEQHFAFVESKRDYLEERALYLDALIGREVGVSLFETFKQRKGELGTPVRFWKWTVPIMTFATVIWIFFLFNGLDSINDVTQRWEFIAINTVKSMPVLLLLLFSISQYVKERSFQEEYAFKSAVALTIDAYANRLQNTDAKDKFITDAVLEVYHSPIEKKVPKDDARYKASIETMKNLADSVKEMVKTCK